MGLAWGHRWGSLITQDVHENWQAKKTVLYLGAEDWARAGPGDQREGIGKGVGGEECHLPEGLLPLSREASSPGKLY